MRRFPSAPRRDQEVPCTGFLFVGRPVLVGGERCEGGQPGALISLTLPTEDGGTSGMGREGKTPTVTRKHHKGANIPGAVKGEALPSSLSAGSSMLTALIIFGAGGLKKCHVPVYISRA